MRLRLHGDTIAAPGLLDFATCVWPSADPPWLEPELERALDGRHRYPDERQAREAIAHRHGRDPSEVLLLNGACEAFWLLAHALRPGRAACVHPSFTEPEAALRAVGAEVTRVALDSDRWRLDSAAIPDFVELLVIGNPNNPTGTLHSPGGLAALARGERLVIVDESFIDFVPGDGASLAARSDLPGLVVIRSLTKLFALAGIRAGYLLASAELVERLQANRQPWSVNGLACRTLAISATDHATANRISSEVSVVRAELIERLEAMPGVHVWPSAANFLLLRVENAGGLIDSLRERGIAVRPAASFPGLDEHHIRIAVRPRADNVALLAGIEEATCSSC